MADKYFKHLLIIIFLLALVLRLSCGFELYYNDVQVTRPSGFTDMWTYNDLANKIIGGEYKGEYYYQPFYYAVFLPAVKLISGGHVVGLVIAQALLGALTVLLCMLSAKRLAGARAGIASGILLAFASMPVLYTPYSLIELLQGFWIVLIFFLIQRAVENFDPKRWAVLGLVVGSSILTRGNIWILFPGIAAASFFPFIMQRRTRFESWSIFKKMLPFTLLLAFTILPQIPFAVKNSLIKGTLSGPSTAGGAVLALGNTPEAPPGGRNPGTGPGPMEYPPSYKIWMEKAEAGQSVPSQIISWASREPLAFLELSFRKMLLFWDAREIPNNIAPEYQGPKSNTYSYVSIVPTGLLMVLTIAAFIVSLKLMLRWRQLRMLFFLIIAYWLATAMFYILARFRLPCIGLFAISSGLFVELLIREFVAGNQKKIFKLYLPALLIGVFVSYLAYDLYRFNFEVSVMRLVRPDGVHVHVSPKELMLLDNGPFTLGSWSSLKLTNGTEIRKKLGAYAPESASLMTVTMPLLWEEKGMIVLDFNGQRRSFIAYAPGMQEIEVNLPYPQDGILTVKVVRADAIASFLADFQRDYGRTFVNGVQLPGELVVRMNCKK